MHTRWTSWQRVVCLAAVAVVPAGPLPAAQTDRFDDFLRRDREQYEDFLKGRSKDSPPKPVARPAERTSQPSRLDPEGNTPREQATWLFRMYGRLERELNAPYVPDEANPAWLGTGGLRAMAKEREERLYPNGRQWRFFDSVFWFGSSEKKALRDALRRNEAEVKSHEQKLRSIVEKWNELGFGDKVGPLETFYGDTVSQKWDYEKKEYVTGTFDAIAVAIEGTWPPGGAHPPPAGVTPPAAPPPGNTGETVPDELGPGTAPDGMTEQLAKPPAPPPPVKAWDDMTPAERHEALKRNDPEAWQKIGEMLLGTDIKEGSKSAAEVKEAIATSTTTPPEAPPPTPPAAKPWSAMSSEERHEALKRSDKATWWAARDALLSGDGKRVDAVVAALSARHVPDDVIAFTYVIVYKLATLSGTPGEATGLEAFGGALGLIVAGKMIESYAHIPAIADAVQLAKDDAAAGRGPRYSAPAQIAQVLTWFGATQPSKDIPQGRETVPTTSPP